MVDFIKSGKSLTDSFSSSFFNDDFFAREREREREYERERERERVSWMAKTGQFLAGS